MNITLQRDALLKPLQAVSGVVEKKPSTQPVLSNVLLSTKEGKLWLTGTDLEIELIGFVPVESLVTEGTTTVSAKTLFDICRTLPETATLHLSLEKNYLIVSAGESCFMLNTLAPDHFPNLEDTSYSIQFPIQQGHLKNLFTKTHFAMAQQDVRHYLNGAFLDISQKTVKCVAADGHRLALASIQDEQIGVAEANVILPRKSVLELMRLLNDTDQPAMVHIGDTRFRITTAEYIFTSKLINAQYPDYNRLIPRGTTVATGERESIKQALIRSAAILSNEKFRGVRFQLEPGKLLISTNNSDQEQAKEAVNLDYAGQAMEVGFNVNYLLDVVSAMASKTMRCIFTGPNEGVRMEPAENDYCVYVVMPMRL